MASSPEPSRSVSKKEFLLWSAIAGYIGIIYATLPLVPLLRKALVERFGYDIFDWIYAIFVFAGLLLFGRGIRTFRGLALVRYFVVIGVIGAVFIWYQSRLPYAIERIHLFEYGLLGLLFCLAFHRRLPAIAAFGAAAVATYCAGIVDEAIQGVSATRVGEIRDALTNAVSGAFGVVICAVSQGSARKGTAFRPGHLRVPFVLSAAAIAGTGLFLWAIQGFGHVVEDGELRFYSGIAGPRLGEIGRTGGFHSRAEEKMFENEAKRHLFQRDFYFTNDFMARDGSSYRDYRKALGEQRILERWYGPFLRKNGTLQTRLFSGATDRSVGEALGTTTVAWPDSLKVWVTEQAGGDSGYFTSRVKSTVITRFSPGHLLAVEAGLLLLFALVWRLVSGKMAAGKTRTG
ncbi:MAG: VanZ family protein [Chitinispirillaceae bacterium]|nr:VanZ family protein [Chitinispirillaceae bacterium]